ncbi:hypothetical protein F0562_030816 [Nyssa sinensis]|uniref:RING-type E3 ubiquitin transferase n=1 Tax=Nyssa sinensis TaxID=561372 RepID=A0A5J5AZM1_9ASTE|nr:hypothetical protein F0562_030816 [Nyssa sinensis]
MLNQRRNGEKKEELVAVAIDKDKGSQYALKWAVDHLLEKGQSVTLLHVKHRASSIPTPLGNNVALSDVNEDVAKAYKYQLDNQAKELFLPFRCFCTRKDIKCNEVIVEDTDIAKALCDYVKLNLVEILVVGAAPRSGFVRFKPTDIPSSISKAAPEFCSVYVIARGKISSVRSASCPLPNPPPRKQNQSSPISSQFNARLTQNSGSRAEKTPFAPRNLIEDVEIRSPFNRTQTQKIEAVGHHSQDPDYADPNLHGFSSSSQDSMSCSSSHTMDEMEAEMRRLKQELRQTMDLYSSACKEALCAKQKAMELHHWKIEEQQKLEDARVAEEAALAIAERERAKSKAAIEAAQAAQRIAELEAQKRIKAEMKAFKEAEEKKKVLDTLAQSDLRYRKYTIDEIEAATEYFVESRKIGEGGYGPVYKCYLDHTPVAIKVLRPDAAQGRSQFQQEVEVLSCIRHPNMVLLLGACPEYGCLVYEYMANGSLEDRLFLRGNSPVLPWQLRFRIAAEIGTALLFLHQTKPEPLVHRDLKPANILLDNNFVSKIGDVGLARLVPPSVADTVTQYRMTSTAGTFCYIDPEYQQTGMLGIKSDIYSLGIMLLQIITAKPPMGLTHHVERAIERGTFTDFLDPNVPDWPVEEALIFAKLALKCAELRRKDRPDLGKVVLPELNKLRALAEENISSSIFLGGSPRVSPFQSQPSLTSQETMTDPQLRQSGYESSRSRSSTSSFATERNQTDNYI